jgi:hypothetical protein
MGCPMARRRRFTAADLGLEEARPRGSRQGGPSRNEARYQEHLEALQAAGEVLEFKAQPAAVELAHRCTWTPDFMVMRPDGFEMVEVKGRKGCRPWYRDDGARVKVKVAARVLAARGIQVVVVWPKKGGGWCREVVPA